MDAFEIADKVKSMTDFTPKIGIVLGSGLEGLSREIEVVDRISYDSLSQGLRLVEKIIEEME